MEPRLRALMIGAMVALVLAAVAAALVFEMPSRVTLPIALALSALVIWSAVRPRRSATGQELGFALSSLARKGGDPGLARELRQAFSDHFAGRRGLALGESGGRAQLEAAIAGFDRFIDHLDAAGANGPHGGLLASALFHRAASRQILAMAEPDADRRREGLAGALADLLGFEERFRPWPMLLPAALALRLRCRLGLDELALAEQDQHLLDRDFGAQTATAELLAARHDLAMALWQRAGTEGEADGERGLRVRAIAQLEAWLNLMPRPPLAARLELARCRARLEEHERVVALLGGLAGEGDAEKRDLLEAERLLAAAYLGLGAHEKALSCYSVLMSVTGPHNPWHRDPEVLREIGRAERALAGDPEPDGD
ncbi:MAG: hypothetical protein H6807_16965 [Planctomycetes bacterium]|nr:hypothetical protein [Planctomycetota bacterium]